MTTALIVTLVVLAFLVGTILCVGAGADASVLVPVFVVVLFVSW